MMIQFIRILKTSIHIQVDVAGIKMLLHAFQAALLEQEFQILIQVDQAIFLQKTTIQPMNFLCKKGPSILTKKENEMVLELEQEDFEYGIVKLQEALCKNYFFPAEFCQVVLPKKTPITYYLYFEYVTEIG